MLRSMSSQELTEWVAYYWVKSEAMKPKPQTAKEARTVLNSMAKAGKGRKKWR